MTDTYWDTAAGTFTTTEAYQRRLRLQRRWRRLKGWVRPRERLLDALAFVFGR